MVRDSLHWKGERGCKNLKTTGRNNRITNVKVRIKSENAYLKSYTEASKMVHLVKVLPYKPKDLGSIP